MRLIREATQIWPLVSNHLLLKLVAYSEPHALHNKLTTSIHHSKLMKIGHIVSVIQSPHTSFIYYAALLPRRGPHIASHSVCPSVCLSVPLWLPSVTSRHLANYNDTHVLFRTRWGPHIVRPSRPHKLAVISVLPVQCKLFCISRSV